MMDGIHAARHLRRINCAVKIVFISASSDTEIAGLAISSEASGFVLKSRMATDLVHAIREALAGRQFVSETVDAIVPCSQPWRPSEATEAVTR